MITLDGSHGEGGGQILRTALSLSAITGNPVRITNIRANRPKPGLRPQHLSGLLAMADVTAARLSGAEVGSREVVFEPGPVRPGEYYCDVSRISGSAGSVTLIMQTLLPALSVASGPAKVKLKGGTHVAWSPPFQYLSECFLPAVGTMGVNAEAALSRWGFYPRGGGDAELRVRPSGGLTPLELTGRGPLLGVTGVSAVANLPAGIAERQARAAREHLSAAGIDADLRIQEAESVGPGTFIYLSARFEHITLGFSALGERGKRAETVGEEAASGLTGFLATGACVEEHLSDQLVPYMALAKGVSRMSVSKISRHLLTNIEVARMLLPGLEAAVEGAEGGPGTVTVEGRGL